MKLPECDYARSIISAVIQGRSALPIVNTTPKRIERGTPCALSKERPTPLR